MTSKSKSSMNKVLSSKRGELMLIDTPLPLLQEHEVLIETAYSAISGGTESTIRQTTSLKSIVKAASQRLDMVKDLGVERSMKTLSKVLEGHQLLGYSLVGKVVAVGKDVIGIEKGDIVAATGSGKAIHAKYVAVPSVYVCKVSTLVPEYALAGVMTIGVNGFNKAQISLGDSVAVIGGGLIGELSALCCKAGGADVDILEINPDAVKRLEKSGFSVKTSLEREYDAIIIAADTTSTFPLAQKHIRYGGRIVITGYGDLTIDRGILEAKQPVIACVDSYGMGANHHFYELQKGDILAHYNANTARRNLERAVFLIDHGFAASYKIIPAAKYNDIDALLAAKGISTVILSWK